jgi:hypothetical protein
MSSDTLTWCRRPSSVAVVRDQRDRYLLADLDAFLQEHRRCGDLESAVEGDRVWMACTCGAVLVRVPAFG